MATMFDYDWFYGPRLERQREEARRRCTVRRFPDVDFDNPDCENEDVRRFYEELDIRELFYLRDGFSYEVRQLVDVESKTHLTFECEPVDDHYKVGAFVVTVPFEEIVRVEVFAVHPNEKPEDMPQIPGFRGQRGGAEQAPR